MLDRVTGFLISRAERRLGVALDYVRQIARTDLRLLLRYNRIFGMLDPNRHAPPAAYHIARLRGAVAADCGICVEAEITLARRAGLTGDMIARVLSADYAALAASEAAAARLADAVCARREDDPEARAVLVAAYGEAGLIELAFAMNGAALLPGIKRAMGHATACNLSVLRAMR